MILVKNIILTLTFSITKFLQPHLIFMTIQHTMNELKNYLPYTIRLSINVVEQKRLNYPSITRNTEKPKDSGILTSILSFRFFLCFCFGPYKKNNARVSTKNSRSHNSYTSSGTRVNLTKTYVQHKCSGKWILTYFSSNFLARAWSFSWSPSSSAGNSFSVASPTLGCS